MSFLVGYVAKPKRLSLFVLHLVFFLSVHLKNSEVGFYLLVSGGGGVVTYNLKMLCTPPCGNFIFRSSLYFFFLCTSVHILAIV